MSSEEAAALKDSNNHGIYVIKLVVQTVSSDTCKRRAEASPGHDGVHGVLPLVEDLVVVAVTNAHLGDLNADILGPRSPPGEFEWHQLALVVMCGDANGSAACGVNRGWVDNMTASLIILAISP